MNDKPYIGVFHANAAWLHFRARDFEAAQIQAEIAYANWVDTPYPFQWLVNWPLLALALKDDHLLAAVKSALAIVNPKQQKLPDALDDLLTTAVTAYEAGDEEKAQASLATAVDLAAQYGYL